MENSQIQIEVTPKNEFLFWLLERYAFTLTSETSNDMSDAALIALCETNHPDAVKVWVEADSRSEKRVCYKLPTDEEGSHHYSVAYPKWIPNQITVKLEPNAVVFVSGKNQVGLGFTQFEQEVEEFARTNQGLIYLIPNADHLAYEVFAKIGLEPVPYKKWPRRWDSLFKKIGIRKTPWHQRVVAKLRKCSKMEHLGPVVFAK